MNKETKMEDKKEIKYKYTTYLAGPIEADEENGGEAWRVKLTPKLEEIGVKVLDPCVLEPLKVGCDSKTLRDKLTGWKRAGHWLPFMDAMDKIWIGDVNAPGDLECVRQSTFIIVYANLKIPTSGTKFEMEESLTHKIPIFYVTPDPKTEVNNSELWCVMKSNGAVNPDECVFPSFNKLIEFLKTKYK